MDKDGSTEGSSTGILVLGIIVFLLLLAMIALEGMYNCSQPPPPLPPGGTPILVLTPWKLQDVETIR